MAADLVDAGARRQRGPARRQLALVADAGAAAPGDLRSGLKALEREELPRILTAVLALGLEALVGIRPGDGPDLADDGDAGHSAVTWRCRGLLALATEDVNAAEAAFERALALHASVDLPLERARALLGYGIALRRKRRKTGARVALGQALEHFQRLGAGQYAERASDELAQLGGRFPIPGRLTATEERIAELVARGRSNHEVARALYVSPKTVEWNLSKVYRKLGVRSRTELAAKFARRVAMAD